MKDLLKKIGIFFGKSTYMFATGQEKVREKLIFSSSGKSQGILNINRENGNLKKKSQKNYHGQGKFRFHVQDIWGTPLSSYFSAVILFQI